MLKFLLRRFANYLVLVGLAACLGYFLAASSLHPRSNYELRNPRPSQESIESKLNELNLNDRTPLVERFTRWASHFVKGDMGKTIQERPLWEEMKRRMGVSLRLLALGSLIGAAAGVALGVLGAVKQYSWFDHSSTAWSFVILSTPVFLLAVLLKYAGTHYWNAHVPTGFDLYFVGEYTPNLGGGFIHAARDRLTHLVVPTLGIVLGQIAFYSRYQRNSFLDVMGADFLRTAQAKGLRRRTALIKHGLRTALIPMATFFAYSFGLLLTGATFTEKIFAWHGMGEWFIDAVNSNDVNVVAAVIVFQAVLILVAGLIADVLYAALDPAGTDPVAMAVVKEPEVITPQEEDGHEVVGRGRLVWRRFLRRKVAIGGFVVLIGMFILAFAGPHFTSWKYLDQDLNNALQGPSLNHYFGTTLLGQDVFVRTMRGLQKSLVIGLLTAFFSTGTAAVVGASAGYFGGWVDRVLMWVVDLLLVLPSFIIIAILSPQFKGKSWLLFVVVLAAFSWMITARIVRGLTLSLREREFVQAARYMGVPSRKIIFRHLLPNMSSFLIIDATLNVGGAILAESGLSYFGFGVQFPDVSLGNLIADGVGSALTFPWIFFFPGLCLITTVLAVNVMGDGLRDALDPNSSAVKARTIK